MRTGDIPDRTVLTSHSNKATARAQSSTRKFHPPSTVKSHDRISDVTIPAQNEAVGCCCQKLLRTYDNYMMRRWLALKSPPASAVSSIYICLHAQVPLRARYITRCNGVLPPTICTFSVPFLSVMCHCACESEIRVKCCNCGMPPRPLRSSASLHFWLLSCGMALVCMQYMTCCRFCDRCCVCAPRYQREEERGTHKLLRLTPALQCMPLPLPNTWTQTVCRYTPIHKDNGQQPARSLHADTCP